ncbi:Hypothetical protein NCS54_01219800 [Fusarium falciforme]|uniref:Hypothetical protein n=1 Tax=Fusarium falciforme TaxID=195108 RepID=UPI002300964A|nr:Hypothetical protein NCS54_01219800 [Fusarium falciforme]WAO94607.1 Hypothetical protein NCS54_01219800 [Fusarium falciforme]
MDDEESLSHQLAIKLLIEELEVDDALKEKRRQRASAEVLADRTAPEESTALPSGTSTHTGRLCDLYQDTLGPSVVDQPSQETAGEKGLVVDAAGNAPKPSPAPVTEDDDHREDDDDLYRDDGVTINRRPEASPTPAAAASPAPVTDDGVCLYRDDETTINRQPKACPARTVAPVPAPVTEEDSDIYRDDGKALDRKPKPSVARLTDIYTNLSRDDKFISYRQRTLKNLPRDKKPFKILNLGEAHRIAAEARRRDPLSNLPVEANDRRRTVCGLTQVVGAPARRSQSVVIHQDNDEEDLISFENTVTFRPQTQPEDSSLRSMASDSTLSGKSSLQAQQTRTLRSQPSLPVNPLRSVSSGFLISGSSSIPSQPSRPETASLHSRTSGFLRPGTPSRHTQSFCPDTTLRRPETFSIHSETSSSYSQSSPPESSCTETSVRSSGTILRPETSSSRLFRPQPSSSRFAPFANPRPEDNVRLRGANAETDPDKENVYCHSCGNDCEESVVLCPCGHYYCPQCLGRIVESSVGGDSSHFPPLCCGKPVPVDVNSTIFDKDVLEAFMEKKLGLPLSARATRAARILPPAAKVGP